MRTWLYRSSILLLTCPAIAIIVESDVPLSASWVMAQCQRSTPIEIGTTAYTGFETKVLGGLHKVAVRFINWIVGCNRVLT